MMISKSRGRCTLSGARQAADRLSRLFTYPIEYVVARLAPAVYARRQGVAMAGEVIIYGSSRVMFGSEPFLISLGDNVHICDGVKFLTHDGGVLPFRKRHETLDRAAAISIGSNVFIGANALILMGLRVGDDCIVGAGAVVTRAVPDGSIVAGNPARRIGSTRDYLDRNLALSSGVGHLPHWEKVEAYRKLAR